HVLLRDAAGVNRTHRNWCTEEDINTGVFYIGYTIAKAHHANADAFNGGGVAITWLHRHR
ncbi:hypothetical protein, partial [Xylella fastidiosa]|uniref:hypothetical protein n=1 Tax=Xylella fastidiosa TaxID=2371 RepID=UPI001EEB7FCA